MTDRKGEKQLPMTESRKNLFLAALLESGGVFSTACRVASPHSKAKGATPPCYTSWRALMARDPEFASQVAETMEMVKEAVYSEIYRRAMEGVETPVFQKGERAVDHDGTPASLTHYDNKLLLRLAARLDPENWSETKNVNHSVVHSGAAVMLKPSDLQALSADQTAHLQDILITIQSSRGEQRAIEHNPGQMIDVDFEEIEEITDAELAEAIPY